MDNQILVHAVKTALKNRKITYSQLSKKLGLTESAVKKMFAVGDMTLRRLSSICDFLDIPLSGLISFAENLPQKNVVLSSEQANFFSKNPNYFFFYLRLVHERDSVDQISRDCKLNKKSVWKYLKKLDDLNLIKLSPGDRVTPEKKIANKISAQNEALNSVRKKMASSFVDKIPDETLEQDLQLHFMKLTMDANESLRRELNEILDKYTRISNNQLAVIGKDELNTTTVLCGFRGETFSGPIPNIA